MMIRLLGGTVAALALGGALAAGAGAQSAKPTPVPTPSPIVVPTLPPSDATTQTIIRAAAGLLNEILVRERINTANNASGTVTYFKRYDLQLQTGNNAYRTVRLHAGTVINPRGATPGVGTTVQISGRGASDGALEADTITVLH